MSNFLMRNKWVVSGTGCPVLVDFVFIRDNFPRLVSIDLERVLTCQSLSSSEVTIRLNYFLQFQFYLWFNYKQ